MVQPSKCAVGALDSETEPWCHHCCRSLHILLPPTILVHTSSPQLSAHNIHMRDPKGITV
eukprot:4300905-Prorocentrum_lima.AAC.1